MPLPFYNVVPPSNGSQDWRLDVALIPSFRAALGDVGINAGDCRILFVGDSTTFGTGGNSSTAPRLTAYPAQLATLTKNLTGLRVSNALGVPYWNISIGAAEADSRFVLTSGFTQRTGAAGFGNCCFTVNSTGTLTFTPGDGLAYDSYNVYTQGSLGGGVLSATATGGSATTLTVPSSSNIGKWTVRGSASTSSNIVLTWTSGNVQVVAIEAFNSTTSQILFGNVGVPASKTSDWAISNTSLNAIKSFAPDLVVVMLGINDGQASVTPSAYIQNIKAILSTPNVGNWVLMSPFPSDPTQQAWLFEGTYSNLLQSFAASNGIPYIDIFNRFGAQHENALFHDVLHPNNSGYFDTARFMLSNLFL